MRGQRKYSIEHRWKFFFGSLLFLVRWRIYLLPAKYSSFFPEDVQYWSYIDVWLPNDANLGATNETTLRWSRLFKQQAASFQGTCMERQLRQRRSVLRYVTTFVGGGGPRFWFSASPQLPTVELRAGPDRGEG